MDQSRTFEAVFHANQILLALRRFTWIATESWSQTITRSFVMD